MYQPHHVIGHDLVATTPDRNKPVGIRPLGAVDDINPHLANRQPDQSSQKPEQQIRTQ
jgi:hypothetical protein